MEVSLTEKELEFLEHYFDPTSLTENLIPENFNAPQTWDEECECVYLYPYQMAMQNYSYMYAIDPRLNKKENFRKKKGAGDCYHIGSRDTGKSFFLKIDCLLTIIHKIREACIASFDFKHLKNVTDPIASFVEAHPFFEIFRLKDSRKKTVARSPFVVTTEHGSLIKAANEKVDSPDPGQAFHSLHYETLYYEEASYMSDEGTKKRVDSGSSIGHIERLSGIPDLRIGSPLTKLLQNPKKKNWIWRLPQYCKESWDNHTRALKVAEYEGENSAAYRLNVEAEIIEGAYGFWDIKRLKNKCFRQDRKIKFFEVSKDNFHKFKNMLMVDRLPGSEQVYICSDIGSSASPSEVIILFFDGEKYKYHYNISLFKLTQKEQAEVFYWLYYKLGSAFIALDSTNLDGGGIIDILFDMGIPADHLLKVRFNENIEVDFEKDDNGNVEFDKAGRPVMKKVRTIDWAMQQLELLFYEGLIEVPIDEKFFKEFNGYIVKQTGMKKVYGSTTTDHLHQSFQCFGICRYFNSENPLKNMKQKKRCYGVFSKNRGKE